MADFSEEWEGDMAETPAAGASKTKDVGKATESCGNTHLCEQCFEEVAKQIYSDMIMVQAYKAAALDPSNRTGADVQNSVNRYLAERGLAHQTAAHTDIEGKPVMDHPAQGPCAAMINAMTSAHERVHSETQKDLAERVGQELGISPERTSDYLRGLSWEDQHAGRLYQGGTDPVYMQFRKGYLDQRNASLNWATDEMAAHSHTIYLLTKFLKDCAKAGVHKRAEFRDGTVIQM
jgi:hypothetical protein